MAEDGAKRARPLRPLLPRSELPPWELPPGVNLTLPKRPIVKSPCNACRQRKCDGQRPSCSRCDTAGRECVYDTAPSETKSAALKRKQEELHERVEDLERLPTLLKTRTLQEATEIVNRLRSGEQSSSATLRDVRGADLLLQWSAAPRAGAAPQSLEEAGGSTALGSTSSKEPVLLPQYSSDRMLRSPLDNPEYIYEKSWRNVRDVHAEDDVFVYLSRFTLPVSRWTEVPLDNKLLNHILLLFWTWDCIVNRTIDRTMFEEHLSLFSPTSMPPSDQPCFCSSFLVNALLAVGCLYSTNEDTFLVPGDHLTRGAAFAKEAVRLLPLEHSISSITLVQGIAALIIWEGCLGKVTTALGYMNSYGENYRTLDLDLLQAQATGPLESKVAHALSYIHWGCYIYEWKQKYSLGRPKYIRKPKTPKLWLDERTSPLSSEEAADYWWFAYPLSLAPQKSIKRELFAAECELVEILEDVLDFLYSPEGLPLVRDNFRKAAELYNKLISWKFSLPEMLREENAVHPAAILIHANLDMAIINLLRPFEAIPRAQFGPFDPLATSYSHAHSLISIIWTFRALYTAKFEFFNTQPLSIAAFRVLFDLESNPLQLQTFVRACQILIELSERIPLARDVLASLQQMVAQRRLSIPSFVQAKLETDVGGPAGSMMHLTVVQTALRNGNAPEESDRAVFLSMSDLLAVEDSSGEPD